MQRKLLIATHNPAKVQEISRLLAELPFRIVSLADLGITQDVEEDGETFTANSRKKASFYSKLTNIPSLADDGGLAIAALGGQPGVKSKRWLGENTTEQDIIAHMIMLTQTLPESARDATFSTVMTFALPSGQTWSASGSIRGIIPTHYMKRHIPGFPYRSFFYLPEIKKFHHDDELTPDEVQQYNHRAKAITKLKPRLLKQLET